MNFQISASSGKDIGGRDEQQDSVIHRVSSDSKKAMLVLADGMGGHSGGAAGSACILSAAEIGWESFIDSSVSPDEILNIIYMQASTCMKELQEKKDISPRSTYVALFLEKNTVYYAHLGDSRLYHFRNGQLLYKTKDHSVVQLLVGMGHLLEEKMATHEDQGKLLKWVGGNKMHQLIVEKSEIIAGDQFLLCSDGLWEYITTEQMEKALHHTNNLETIVSSLILLAKESGKERGDNISLAVLSVNKNSKEPYFRKILRGLIK